MKAYLQTGNFSEIKAIDDVHSIHITQEVRDRCADNYCGFYGKNYMCPPAVGDLEYYRELILAYQKGLIFSKIYSLKNKYDHKGMLKSGLEFRDEIQKISKAAKSENFDCLFFTAGTCSICQTCAILSQEPCRFPDETMPSLEASGIDVVTLSHDLGMTYNNGENKVTYFGLVLYKD